MVQARMSAADTSASVQAHMCHSLTAALRCRPQVRALLERWRSDMLNATKARHITPDKHGNWTVTDQLALTLIFTVCILP